MTKQYRIVIHKNNRKWCSIDIETPWSEEVLQDIEKKFSTNTDYTFEILEATDENRICIVGPEGTKVLSREMVFTSTSNINKQIG